jgi:exonuclease SbcD
MAQLEDSFDPRHDVSVFAAHQYVAGAVLSRSENPNHVCDFYATDPQHLPAVTYAAFGHIHKPQALPGSRTVGRYAGSPLQLDFGEAGEQKSVLLVDLQPGQPPAIEQVALRRGRALRDLYGTLDEIRDQAPQVGTDICRVFVTSETHIDNLAGQVRALLPDATIAYLRPIVGDEQLELPAPDEDHSDVDTTTLFSEYLATHGVDGVPAQRVLHVFASLLPYAGEEDPPPLPEEHLLAEDPETAFPVPLAAAATPGATA